MKNVPEPAHVNPPSPVRRPPPQPSTRSNNARIPPITREVSAYSQMPRRFFRWDPYVELNERQRSELFSWFKSAAVPSRFIKDEKPLDPSLWATNLARAIIEVSLRIRPVSQLQRWLLPPLYTALRRMPLPSTPPSGPKVCRPLNWSIQEVSPSIYEANVVISIPGGQVSVVALRIEEFRGRWMTTALEFA